MSRRNQRPDLAMFFAKKAQETAEFCLRHGKHCFEKWQVPTLFAYVFFHVAERTVFVLRSHGEITGVLFAWAMPEADIRQSAATGQSPFKWQRSQDNADSILCAEVIASRENISALVKQAQARWPNLNTKKIFTFRKGA